MASLIFAIISSGNGFRWEIPEQIPTWLSSYIHYGMWNLIMYPFLKLSDAIIEVWELTDKSIFII